MAELEPFKVRLIALADQVCGFESMQPFSNSKNFHVSQTDTVVKGKKTGVVTKFKKSIGVKWTFWT